MARGESLTTTPLPPPPPATRRSRPPTKVREKARVDPAGPRPHTPRWYQKWTLLGLPLLPLLLSLPFLMGALPPGKRLRPGSPASLSAPGLTQLPPPPSWRESLPPQASSPRLPDRTGTPRTPSEEVPRPQPPWRREKRSSPPPLTVPRKRANPRGAALDQGVLNGEWDTSPYPPRGRARGEQTRTPSLPNRTTETGRVPPGISSARGRLMLPLMVPPRYPSPLPHGPTVARGPLLGSGPVLPSNPVTTPFPGNGTLHWDPQIAPRKRSPG